MRSLSLPTILCTLTATVVHSFHNIHPPILTITTHPSTSTTSLHGLKKGGKFGKQKDLAAKMEAAKRQRQVADGSLSPTSSSEQEESLSPEEIKLRNDRKRFESLLSSSLRNDSDGLGGDYLTVQQEEENAEAVFRGVARLYEGDPAPSTPFAELVSIENGEPIGKGGVERLLPNKADDYIVVITDPRPKSVELRSAIRKLVSGTVNEEIVKRCIVINPDSPGENRKMMKKLSGDSLAGKLRVLVDEDLEWMREYTALGEKRFSMSMFILSDGKCQKIARDVDGDLIGSVITNAVNAMKDNRY
ncbi:hypothetical protein ACHAWO_001648 [Cyclotella atomus]|uniref:Uncharacterized protein n=1 Tax=Cyclotella atomus TaxID=382360 RepID=A0ABD3PZL5_9STRA